MGRRNVLSGTSAVILSGLAGCATIQGLLFGKTPERFDLKNETASPTSVQIVIEADDSIVLDKTYTVPAKKTISKAWPKTDATTYTISAKTKNDESAFTFDPGDWKKRHTPLVLLSNNGVEVFVNG